jgi:membrane glycosyltransferase
MLGVLERHLFVSRRWVIGILLILHGLIHLLGFLTSWDLVEVPGLSRTPTIFTDDPPVGVLRDLGILWLAGLIAFSLAGYAVIRGLRWWEGLTFVSAIVSFIATLFWIHEAWFGTILNGLIILLIARDWWQQHNDVPSAANPSLRQ